jgi:phage-related minor tail protein
LEDQLKDELSKIDIGKDVGRISELNIPFPLATITPALQAQAALAKTAFDDINTRALQTQEILSSTLAPAFQGLFENIISGSQNAFRAFTDALKQLVVKIASAALTALAFAAILSIIAPGSTTFAAKFGSIFSGLSGLKLGAHAAGGITKGPSFGLIGEAGPEAIIPLDKLPGILAGMNGGGQQVYIPNLTVRGTDLVVAFNRASNQLGSSIR